MESIYEGQFLFTEDIVEKQAILEEKEDLFGGPDPLAN